MHIDQVLHNLNPAAWVFQTVVQQALVELGPETKGPLPFWCEIEVLKEQINDLQVEVHAESYQERQNLHFFMFFHAIRELSLVLDPLRLIHVFERHLVGKAAGPKVPLFENLVMFWCKVLA